ncbi:hypothetical protein GCM10011360_21940 [Primorskyibacter flagellatus]|uniref:Uncharacterized protein n=1 Tax=Primorskyibacter flagellatus TaxID=1387277 RepID=A0A917EF97_9RHOB|nr:hypothetical protein GCM10011360_21940 [Primorskyibacter flagellatus]
MADMLSTADPEPEVTVSAFAAADVRRSAARAAGAIRFMKLSATTDPPAIRDRDQDMTFKYSAGTITQCDNWPNTEVRTASRPRSID